MRITQHQIILQCLRNKFNQTPDGWVKLPIILKLGIAQYGRVINDLRLGKVRALGKKVYNIENKTRWIGDNRHSWFRLVEPTIYSSQMEFKGMRAEQNKLDLSFRGEII